METERYNGNGSGIIDESGSRPLSQTSSELDALSPLQVKLRDKPRLQVSYFKIFPQYNNSGKFINSCKFISETINKVFANKVRVFGFKKSH